MIRSSSSVTFIWRHVGQLLMIIIIMIPDRVVVQSIQSGVQSSLSDPYLIPSAQALSASSTFGIVKIGE